jgi:hypothetical protein
MLGLSPMPTGLRFARHGKMPKASGRAPLRGRGRKRFLFHIHVVRMPPQQLKAQHQSGDVRGTDDP